MRHGVGTVRAQLRSSFPRFDVTEWIPARAVFCPNRVHPIWKPRVRDDGGGDGAECQTKPSAVIGALDASNHAVMPQLSAGTRQRFFSRDPIDTTALHGFRGQIQSKLLAYHAGQEAANRMRLPSGTLRHDVDRHSLRRLQPREHLRLLALSTGIRRIRLRTRSRGRSPFYRLRSSRPAPGF